MFKIPFCSQTMFAASTRLSIARLMKANKYVLKNHLDACAFFVRSFRLLALLISGNSFSNNAIFSLAESCENSLDKLSLISLIILTESNFLVFIYYLHRTLMLHSHFCKKGFKDRLHSRLGVFQL